MALALRGGLAHGEERVVREDDVDLLVVDAVLLALGDGDEEDAEDVVAMPLQRRPRIVRVLRRRQEPL